MLRNTIDISRIQPNVLFKLSPILADQRTHPWQKCGGVFSLPSSSIFQLPKLGYNFTSSWWTSMQILLLGDKPHVVQCWHLSG